MFNELQEYFDTLKNDKSPNTIRFYETTLRDFLATCQINSLEDFKQLSAKAIRAYQSSLIERGMMHSSVNAYLRPVSAFFHWLHDNDYMEELAISKVKSLKEPRKEPVFLTEDESNAIINAAPDLQTKCMLTMMIGLGLRRAEVCQLKVSDVRNGQITIHGKGDHYDTLPLNSKIKAVLAQWLKKHNGGEYIFYSTRVRSGRISPQTVFDRVRRACEIAGLDPARVEAITPHKLRHTTATSALANGVDPVTVMNLMRHGSFNITLRYMHVQQKGMQAAVEQIAGLGD